MTELIHHPAREYSWKEEEFWTFKDILYRGEPKTIHVFKKLTSLLDPWPLKEYYKREKHEGNPYPASSDLVWTLASSAYKIREESPEIKDFRRFLQESFRRGISTTSVAVYNPEGEEDEVRHGYEDEIPLKGNLIGPDRKIIPADQEALEMVLGTGKIEQINDVSQWINGNVPSWIWRLKEKPSKQIKWVIQFMAGWGRFNINCYRNPPDIHPAVRVVVE